MRGVCRVREGKERKGKERSGLGKGGPRGKKRGDGSREPDRTKGAFHIQHNTGDKTQIRQPVPAFGITGHPTWFLHLVGKYSTDDPAFRGSVVDVT